MKLKNKYFWSKDLRKALYKELISTSRNYSIRTHTLIDYSQVLKNKSLEKISTQ